MNLERAAMRGKLAEAEDEIKKLGAKAEGLCTALRERLNITLTPIEEMDPMIIGQMSDELIMTLADIAGVRMKIERLNRELR